jgi:hypothetical protein
MRGPLVLFAVVLLGGAVYLGVSRYPGEAELPQPAPVVQTEAAAVTMVSDIGATLPAVKVFKSPTCGCCSEWITHLREHGFEVEAVDTNDMMTIKAALGIAPAMGSCHTAEIGDYVIEGHVPAEAIADFMAEAPEGVIGLTVPGMPVGSPGMEVEGVADDPYDVIQLAADGSTSVYRSYR